MARVRATLPIVLLARACAARLHATQARSSSGRWRPGPAVPWVATVPPQLAARTPAKAACTAAELTIPGQVKFIARLQGGIALLTIQNTGKRACRLTGPPGRQVREARRAEAGPAPDPADAVQLPGGDLSGVEPARPASRRAGGADDLLGQLVRPGGQRRPARPAERGAASRSPAGAATWTPTTTPSRPASTRGCLRRSGSHASSRASSRRAGSSRTPSCRDRCRASRCTAGAAACCASGSCSRTVSHTTATFERCPAYIAQLAPAGRVEAHQLNCAAAHPIAPGKSEAFAMRAARPAQRPARRERPLLGARPLRLAQPAAARPGDRRPLSEPPGRGRALFRTRTGDPLLTMEVLYQLS